MIVQYLVVANPIPASNNFVARTLVVENYICKLVKIKLLSKKKKEDK